MNPDARTQEVWVVPAGRQARYRRRWGWTIPSLMALLIGGGAFLASHALLSARSTPRHQAAATAATVHPMNAPTMVPTTTVPLGSTAQVRVSSTTIDGQQWVVIEGVAFPKASVSVDGTPVQIGQDGQWSLRIKRPSHPTQVRVITRSADGQSRSSVSVTVG